MNFRKTAFSRSFIFGFAMILLMANIAGAQQNFNSVEALVKSKLPRGFQNLILSDDSPEADRKVRSFTQGNYDERIVVVQHFIASDSPITANQRRFANRVVDVELANATVTAVLSDYAEILAMIDPANEAAVAKLISYSTSMAVIQSKRIEFEVTYSAEHPDGREVYGWIGFFSVRKPDLDIDSIAEASANSGREAPFLDPETRRAGASETLNFVNAVLADDSQLAIFRNFFNRLRNGE